MFLSLLPNLYQIIKQRYFIEKSKQENIAWSNVQYLDFEYKIKSGGPSEVIRGIVSYKYNDKTYKAKVFAIWTGEEYRFIEIKGPYQ